MYSRFWTVVLALACFFTGGLFLYAWLFVEPVVPIAWWVYWALITQSWVTGVVVVFFHRDRHKELERQLMRGGRG